MELLCAACLLLVLAGAKGSHIEELVRANNQSAGELPSWYPSTRCSAGVQHTTPPSTGPPVSAELDTETPEENVGDSASADPLAHVDEVVNTDENVIQDDEVTDPPPEGTSSTTTARTTAEYRAPEKLTSPALYIDDE